MKIAILNRETSKGRRCASYGGGFVNIRQPTEGERHASHLVWADVREIWNWQGKSYSMCEAPQER